ncbi:MAG: lytic transglycosylase domain-containing protein [Acidobacteriota bacterium]
MKVFSRTGLLVFALVGVTLMVLMLAVSLIGEYLYQPQLDVLNEVDALAKIQKAKLKQIHLRNRRLMTLVKVREYLSDKRINLPSDQVWNIAISIDRVANRYRLDPEMILAIIHTESAFRSNAVSRKGAVGLMQLLPSTAEAVAREIDLEWTGEELLRDPDINIELGTYYLSKLRDRFDSIEHAVVAYNEGPTRVARLQRNRASFPTMYRDRVFSSVRSSY